jgi:hypothetical protein
MANHIKREARKLRNYLRENGGHTIVVSTKEMQLIKEAVENYLQHQADDMMIFEYQMLLDDINETMEKWEVIE